MAKKEVVQDIFNDIAPKYDLLNHLLSMNIDKGWRRKAMSCIGEQEKGCLLDVACGTGDFSIAAHRAGVKQVTGIDISENMVEIGKKKVGDLHLADAIELKTGGKVIILEVSMPEHFPMKQLYRFYFCHILPTIGGWISGNKGAYTYLPESVMKFPQGETFLQIMRDCGFQHPVRRKLSFGIASLYVGEK